MAALVAGSALVTTSAADADSGWFQIVSKYDGRCLETRWEYPEPRMVVDDCDNIAGNQRWQYEPLYVYGLQFLLHNSTGLCLEADRSLTSLRWGFCDRNNAYQHFTPPDYRSGIPSDYFQVYLSKQRVGVRNGQLALYGQYEAVYPQSQAEWYTRSVCPAPNRPNCGLE